MRRHHHHQKKHDVYHQPNYRQPADQFNDHELEAIIVCVDYADFLEHSLRFNLAHFQRLVVVTSFDDRATQRVCETYSVHCVETDVMHERGDAFNKGAAINLGLGHLRQRGFILHLDADIILPPTFRNVLDKHVVERDSIYGATRVNVRGFEKFERIFLDQFYPQYHHRFLIDTPGDCPVGGTLIHKEFGYCPIGYFQLWHGSARRRYPQVQGSAEHDDVLHALQWRREHRHLLPGVRVFHLESALGPMGENWNGRKSKPFSR